MLIDRYDCATNVEWKSIFFSPINCSDIFIKNKQKRRLKKVLNNKIYLWIIFMSNIFLRNLYVYHRAFFFFSKSREIWFFHPPIYIDLYDCKIVCVLIESRYVERNNRKRISINKSHVHNFNFLEFYNFSLSVYLVKFVKLQIYTYLHFLPRFFENEQSVFIFTYILNSTLFFPNYSSI